MGNCCVTDASSEQETFKWSIDNFPSLLDKSKGRTRSSVFTIMDHYWSLILNPMDRRGDDENYVSLMLELHTSIEPNIIVEASFRFLIYDQLYGKHSEHQVSHSFQTASIRSGKSCMIPLATLINSSGFIINDNCVFGVKLIKVVTTNVMTTSEMLFVQNMSTLNEAKAYTWHIEDFFALKNTGCSPEFKVGGYKWLIRLKRDENHISMYLQKINDLPKGSAILVKFTLSIKDQEGGKHLKNTGQCQFSNNARCWGWKKFVSLGNLEDSSNGYLIQTKCCIEANVAIIGSSMTK